MISRAGGQGCKSQDVKHCGCRWLCCWRNTHAKHGKAGDKAAAASAATADFPGPTTHAPTECGDADTHYDKVLKDEVIPAPLGKVYSMMFGAASGGFISKWMVDELKVTDLQMEDDKKGLTEEKPTRFYSYIKPLYAAIGPKTTKCLSTENLDSFDLEKAVSVTISTQTPDVPSGNVFSVKTRYCLMWAPGNSTRVLINCAVEWTGKSWLKGELRARQIMCCITKLSQDQSRKAPMTDNKRTLMIL